jgi:hypothetical protein
MLDELRAIDLADAERDENTHRCDRCLRPGTAWRGTDWLCDLCRRLADLDLKEEAVCR